MAYADSLPEDKHQEIHSELTAKIEQEHNSVYQANLRKAKSKRAREACAGRYEGAWWRLREAWSNGDVSNLHVRDCLRIDAVIGDAEGVKFSPAGKIKPKKQALAA